MDMDHTLSLTLNEFVQGIEFLRIKLSFDVIKQVFDFLDVNSQGFISFEEFRQLDEENFRKITLDSLSHIVDCNLAKKKLKEQGSQSTENQLEQIQKMTFDELENKTKNQQKKPFNKYVKHMYFRPGRTSTFNSNGSNGRSNSDPGDEEPEFQNSKVDFSSMQKPTEVNPSLFVKARQNDFSETATNMSGFASTATVKRKMDIRDMNHGVPNVFNDNMNEIMSNKFLRDSMERKVNQKINKDQFAKSYSGFPTNLKAAALTEKSSINLGDMKKNLYKNLGTLDPNRSLSQIGQTLDVIKEKQNARNQMNSSSRAFMPTRYSDLKKLVLS